MKTVGHYHFHPAVLDACFHIFKGVQDIPADAAPEDYFYLPAYIRRIRTHCEKPPTRFWAHASLVLDDGQSLVADIYVYDERGHRIADILGFRADRVKQKRVGTEVDDCLYQFRWQPCHLRGSGREGSCQFADSKTIAEVVQGEIGDVYWRHESDRYYHQFAPRIDKLVQQFIENAFVQLGWDPAIGADVEFDQFTRKLGILPEHHRLARADLRSLERAGVLRAVGDDHWTVLRRSARRTLRQNSTPWSKSSLGWHRRSPCTAPRFASRRGAQRRCRSDGVAVPRWLVPSA